MTSKILVFVLLLTSLGFAQGVAGDPGVGDSGSAAAGGATPTFGGTNGSGSSTSGLTVATSAFAVTSGQTIVVALAITGGWNAQFTSITSNDSGDNANVTQLTGAFVTGANQVDVAYFIIKNAVANASKVITANFGNSGIPRKVILAATVSGANASPLDTASVTAAAYPTFGNNLTTSSWSTAQANTLIVMGIVASNLGSPNVNSCTFAGNSGTITAQYGDGSYDLTICGYGSSAIQTTQTASMTVSSGNSYWTYGVFGLKP